MYCSMYFHGLLHLMHTSIACSFYGLESDRKGTLSNPTKGTGLVCGRYGIQTQESDPGIVAHHHITFIYYMTDA